MRPIRTFAITLVASLALIHSALACTDFRLTAKDGTVLITRSLEFAMDLKSNLCTSSRNRNVTTIGPDGKPGMTWKTKYGYAFLNGLNVDMTVDGMNEKGLSFEALYLPSLAEYQTVPQGHNNQAIPYFNLGDWVLGNFASVEEVRAALNNVYVFAQKIPQTGDTIFPLHFAIYDATGKGIVVEYIGGKMKVYDNKIGVMTNSPSYDWHITNLENYVHLRPQNPNPVVNNGMVLAVNGQGFGMMGLPGDISPPSRFVKVATLLQVVLPVNTAADVLNLAEHVINNVDIPLGLAREPGNGNITNDTTQWIVFKDLTHRTFYYRTYADLTVRAVSLDKIDFSENAPRLKMSIEDPAVIQDKTSEFSKAKA